MLEKIGSRARILQKILKSDQVNNFNEYFNLPFCRSCFYFKICFYFCCKTTYTNTTFSQISTFLNITLFKKENIFFYQLYTLLHNY